MFPKGDGKRFENFDVTGKVFVVTGGRQGLGLTLAEGLAEAGGKGKKHPRTSCLCSVEENLC